MPKKKVTLELNVSMLMSTVRDTAKINSLRDIEARCGVSASTLSRLDNGHMPDMQTFMSLCEAFRLLPGDYFSWVEWTGTVLTDYSV